MVKKKPTRKRKHFNDFFIPDYRNINRQDFCGKPECRKAENQIKWLQKPENIDYFKGPANVERVREWLKKHLGYSRRKVSCNKNASQETLPENNNIKQLVKSVNLRLIENELQDFCLIQPAVFIGLISQLTGYALQDDIATQLRSMQQLGTDILNNPNYCKGGMIKKVFMSRELSYAVLKIWFWAARLLFDMFNGP